MLKIRELQIIDNKVMLNFNLGGQNTGFNPGMNMNNNANNMGFNPNFNPNPNMNINTNPGFMGSMNPQNPQNISFNGNLGGNYPTAMNPQGYNAPVLPNTSLPEEQAKQQYINNLLGYIHQQRPANTGLEIVIKYLMQQQQEYLAEMRKCTAIENINQFEEQYLKEVREKFIRLKNNNQYILREMFNVKEKVARVSLPIQRNLKFEQEFSIVHQKIRRVRQQISSKLSNLKNRRLFDQSYSKNKGASKSRYPPINIPLTELKNSTQIINIELIKQRQQIKTLIKQLYDQNI